MTKTNKITRNRKKMKPQFGKLEYSIDLSKYQSNVINIHCIYRRTYQEEDFLFFLQKKLKTTISNYYRNITVVEPNYTPKVGNELTIDITLRLEKAMTTIEKRAYVYDVDGPICEMLAVVEAKIDEAFDDWDNMGRQFKYKCGTSYLIKQETTEE